MNKLGYTVIDININFVFYNHPCESLKHLFFEHNYVKSVWMLPPVIDMNNNMTTYSSFLELYSNWIAGISVSRVVDNIVIEVMATKCWFIWKERCKRIYPRIKPTLVSKPH